jgi:hypothetical protein
MVAGGWGAWGESRCSDARSYICEKPAISNLQLTTVASRRSLLHALVNKVTTSSVVVSIPKMGNHHAGLLKAVVVVKGRPSVPRDVANVTGSIPMVSTTRYPIANSNIGNAIEILGSNFGILCSDMHVTLFSVPPLELKNGGTPSYCTDTRLLVETLTDTSNSLFEGPVYATVTRDLGTLPHSVVYQPVQVAQFSRFQQEDAPLLVASGNTWDTIATEAAGATATRRFRLLEFNNLPEYVQEGDYHVLLEWGTSGAFAQFHVPRGSNIFAKKTDKFVAVDEVITSSPSIIDTGSDALFCHACTIEGAGSVDMSGGNTCWALTPSSDANRDHGCNGASWAGKGIYYAGYTHSGAFAGPIGDASDKGSTSLGLNIKIRRSTGISRVAQYSASDPQKVCCASDGTITYLDLVGGSTNGLTTNFAHCEQTCRDFGTCKFFATNPSLDIDWCMGFATCEFQCDVNLGKTISIYKVESSEGRMPTTATNYQLQLSSGPGAKFTFGDYGGVCATAADSSVAETETTIGSGMTLPECIRTGRVKYLFVSHWTSDGTCKGLTSCGQEHATQDTGARTYTISDAGSTACWETSYTGTCLNSDCDYPPGGNNNVPSIIACQQMCRDESACTWFSYQQASGYCKLMSAKGTIDGSPVSGTTTGPRHCPGTDSELSASDIRVFLTATNGTAPVATVASYGHSKLDVTLSNVTDHNAGKLEAQVVVRGVLSNKVALSVLRPVRPLVFEGCTSVSAGATATCDSDGDGVYEDTCVVGALCLPWNSWATNGGCGSSGNCGGRVFTVARSEVGNRIEIHGERFGTDPSSLSVKFENDGGAAAFTVRSFVTVTDTLLVLDTERTTALDLGAYRAA